MENSKIEPAYVICPPSFASETQSCIPRSLCQSTKISGIPLVTLIKGQTVYQDVTVLAGKCTNCKLKIGQSIWADHGFAMAAITAMYNFHASASAFSKYRNNTYGTKEISISQAHVWQAFVQQSVRIIAEESGIDAELDDGLNIKEVTTQAFSLLGEDGIIRASEGHACD